MNKISMTLLAAVALIGTSCLKDKEYDDQIYGMKGIEDIKLVEFPDAPRKSITLAASNADTTFELLKVRLNEAQPASQDVQVTLAVDTAQAAAQGFAIAPTGSYAFENLTVTIPKGEREIGVMVKATPSLLADQTYAIGLVIQSVTGGNYNISKNFSGIAVALPVKNQYDGNYTATGYVYHPAAPRAFTLAKKVTTAGPNSVTVDLGDLGASGYKALITVDPATNKLTITAAPGAPGAPYTQFDSGLPTSQPGYTASWAGSATANNTYDPATKTFYVRYGYMGGTGWRVTEEQIKRN